MIYRQMILLFSFMLLGLTACVQSQPEPSGNTPSVAICTNCGVNGTVLLTKNFPNQLHVIYRSYFTTDSAMAKGTLYARFCKDPACAEELTKIVIAEDVLLSTGFPFAFGLQQAPLGVSYLQLGLDTAYSRARKEGFPASFDVLQTDAESVGANNSEIGEPALNPVATSLKMQIDNGSTQSLPQLLLGHLVFDTPPSPTVEAEAPRAWIPAGPSGQRNRIRISREGNPEPEHVLDPPRLEGQPFPGDLCGVVRAPNAIYAVGIGLNGAYVFEYDPATRAQRHEHAAFIPHPGCAPTALQCSPTIQQPGLAPAQYPRPCRGVAIDQGGKRRLYLTRDADDNSDATTDRLTGIDVTELPVNKATTVETGSKIFSTLPPKADPPLAGAMRGVTVEGNSLFLASAGWKEDDHHTHIFRYDLPDFTAAAQDLPVIQIATAGALNGLDCGGGQRHPPAFLAARHQGKPRLFVGNDQSISVFEVDGKLIGEIGTADYGKVITDFALSPDGKTLYAVPACKADTFGTLASTTQSQKSDRHRVVILDLTADSDSNNLPDLLHTNRDFDGDGKADGGIDLEFLWLKRDIVGWCETCFGALPPTHIRLPRIAVGNRYLYLRGNTGESKYGVSGLGQLGDVSIFDLATGNGLLFRKYVPWLAGPSAPWGMPLDAAGATATGAVHVTY